MAKKLTDAVLDALLNKIGEGTQLLVNTTEPADRADALSSALASASLSSADFSIGNGSPNGRTLTIAEKATIPVTSTGNATHVSIVSDSELLAVTTTTSQALTLGNTVTIPSWTARVADPV